MENQPIGDHRWAGPDINKKWAQRHFRSAALSEVLCAGTNGPPRCDLAPAVGSAHTGSNGLDLIQATVVRLPPVLGQSSCIKCYFPF